MVGDNEPLLVLDIVEDLEREKAGGGVLSILPFC
jgi:hypothetical protein